MVWIQNWNSGIELHFETIFNLLKKSINMKKKSLDILGLVLYFPPHSQTEILHPSLYELLETAVRTAFSW